MFWGFRVLRTFRAFQAFRGADQWPGRFAVAAPQTVDRAVGRAGEVDDRALGRGKHPGRTAVEVGAEQPAASRPVLLDQRRAAGPVPAGGDLRIEVECGAGTVRTDPLALPPESKS